MAKNFVSNFNSYGQVRWKTNLLDYIASQWQEENASTLFMRAKDLHADDFMLSIRDLLSLDENVTVFDFITYGISSDKQLIIV